MSHYPDQKQDPKSNPVYRYIQTHWRGEFGLAKSFWINGTLVSVVIAVIYIVLLDLQSSEDLHPVSLARYTLFFHLLLYLVWPWQVVGLWRSANRHIEQTNRKFWARYVKFTVVMGVISTALNTAVSMDEYRSVYELGFGKDKYSGFEVQLSETGNLIRFNGRLGIGASDSIKNLLASNTTVTGIILDSPGGWVYEGRQVSIIIREEKLDTYTITGCSSACTIAFVSGNRRTLAYGASLGFHRYSAIGEGRVLPDDTESAQETDLHLFKNAGVDSSFLDRLYSAESDDMWYPSTSELQVANVVHSITDASEFWTFDRIEKNRDEIEEDVLLVSPVYQVLRTYEPELYISILDAYFAQVQEGSSNSAIHEIGRKYIETLATQVLPRTSDIALLEYVRAEIAILKKLEVNNPVDCVRYLNPERYGPIMVWKVLDREDAVAIDRAFAKVIVDSYESPNPGFEHIAAEMVLDWAFDDLDEVTNYLNLPELMGNEDYSGFCRAYISFYENVLEYDEALSVNTFRYLFSSPEESNSSEQLGE